MDFSKNYDDKCGNHGMLRRSGKQRSILKRKPKDRHRNSCWSTGCLHTDNRVYVCVTGHRGMAQMAYWPWEKALEKISCSLLSYCSFLPHSSFNCCWNSSNYGRKFTEKKRESDCPAPSSVSWISLLMTCRNVGDGIDEGNREGWVGPCFLTALSHKVSSNIFFAYYIVTINHLTANLAAMIPKHHHKILIIHPSVICGWGYLLPSNRQTHPLDPSTVLVGKYFLQASQSESSLPITVANWKFPDKFGFPLLQKNCPFIKNKVLWDNLIATKLLRNNQWAWKPVRKFCLASYPILPSWILGSPTFQTCLSLTICVPGTLMRSGEHRLCLISRSQAAKPPGPQFLAVPGFHCSQALGLMSCLVLCSSAVALAMNREPWALKLAVSKLLIQQLMQTTSCCTSSAKARFRLKWGHSELWST